MSPCPRVGLAHHDARSHHDHYRRERVTEPKQDALAMTAKDSWGFPAFARDFPKDADLAKLV